jgi:hypothetical protein
MKKALICLSFGFLSALQMNAQLSLVKISPLRFSGNEHALPKPKSIMFETWSAENLPLFCKIEHKLAKKTPIPIFFRLGSLEYVNWLEQKGSSQDIPWLRP